MDTVVYLENERAAADLALAERIPECLSAAAAAVGEEGMFAFFRGYLDPVDATRAAA